MTNSRGRRTAFRGDDRGSAVAFLPILGLLFFAGIAAGIGIALQGDSDSSVNEPPLITAGQLGDPCTEQAGPVPSGAQARAAWLRSVGDCVDQRISDSLGEAVTSTRSGYAGVVVTTTFAGRPAIVVRWTTAPPAVVTGWAALHEGYVQVASATNAQTT